MTKYDTRGALSAVVGVPVPALCGSVLVEALVEAHLTGNADADLGSIWHAVSEDYVEILRADGKRDAVQSWRSASGHAFEWLVKTRLNQELYREGVGLANQRWVRANAPNIVRFLQLPAKRRCTQDSVDVWPDNDLIALCRRQDGVLHAIAVINCKTSLRERVMQALFWSLAIRVGIPVKSVLVTLDSQGELATCDRPTKPRKLLEAYFDGTYVLNDQAHLCPAIRPFQELPRHLVRWRDELAPDAVREPLELDGGS